MGIERFEDIEAWQLARERKRSQVQRFTVLGYLFFVNLH